MNWFEQRKIYVIEVFDDQQVPMSRIDYSLFPRCLESVEVRTPYKTPPAILHKSLSVDFSMTSILGKDFIVKEQTLYESIKISKSQISIKIYYKFR